uniref:Type II inositol 1,4,5-trisphosphate 5-phosphatase n=1 Tax=Cacopsylla melanoneura TaxID=428564 RepID=A0A8D8ZFS3_9HEMI
MERLKISPKNGIIDPGQREVIVFTVQVTEKIAWKLNVGEESIKDKFYLRISGQKETPIKINGVYKPSVFGFSMDTLAKLNKPLTEMSFDELRAIELKEHPWIGDSSIRAEIPISLWKLIDYLIPMSVHEETIFVKEGWCRMQILRKRRRKKGILAY